MTKKTPPKLKSPDALKAQSDAGERLSLSPLNTEEALRALMQVGPTAELPEHEPCPKTWNGKRCKLQAGHFGPCQYDA